MKRMNHFAHWPWLAGIFLLAFSLFTFSDDNYDEDCPTCTEWDAYEQVCMPITTPSIYIPPETCQNRPINYIVYNSTSGTAGFGAGGYILPALPTTLPNTLSVQSRCYIGNQRYRIEGKFHWPFTINVVDRFIMTSGLCYQGYPAGSEYPRDSVFKEKSEQHELTHCATLTTAINNANTKVNSAGWFLTYPGAYNRMQEIINETATEWTTARTRVLNNDDVAGQPKTTLEGDCLIEKQIGTW